MKPTGPDVAAEKLTTVENGLGWPSAPVIDALPVPITALDSSRTSTASWLCWVARPRPVTMTGAVMVALGAGAVISMRSA